MKLLFLGGPFPKEKEADILNASKGSVQYGANRFQWDFIDGFLSISGLDLQVLSAPFLGTFPMEYKALFIKRFHNLYKNSIPFEYVSFCNLWGYRNISRRNSLIRRIKPYISEKNSEKVIIVYSPHTPLLQAAVYAKKKDPSIHICLIVPDLPEYMNLFEKKSFVYKLMKKIDIRMFEKNVRHVDSFVLLTQQMKDKLCVGSRPYVIVEGTVTVPEKITEPLFNADGKQRVVYAGTLLRKFGILNLVEAVHHLNNPNIELLICGRGDIEDVISEYEKKDNRIHLLGQISGEDSAALVQTATILVNPRQNNEEYTKYSFPSKTMEYLLSGVPVIAYELDGMPDEYKEHIFFVGDDSVDALGKKIEEVLNLPESTRREFGARAREFVIKTKNSGVACERIIKMIKGKEK